MFGTHKYTSIIMRSKHRSLYEENEMWNSLIARRRRYENICCLAVFINFLIQIWPENITEGGMSPDYGPTFIPTLKAVIYSLDTQDLQIPPVRCSQAAEHIG